MFKKSIYWFILLGVLANCTTFGKIKITRDNFKNVDVISVQLQQKSTEKVPVHAGVVILESLIPPYVGNFELFREIKDGKSNPTEIQLSITSSIDSPLLTGKGGLRIGAKMSDVVVSDVTGETITKYSTKANENFVSGKTEVSTSSTSYKVLRGKIFLTKELEEQILKSNDLTVRLYSGNYPITFIFAGDDFLKLKEFLTTKPGPDPV